MSAPIIVAAASTSPNASMLSRDLMSPDLDTSSGQKIGRLYYYNHGGFEYLWGNPEWSYFWGVYISIKHLF